MSPATSATSPPTNREGPRAYLLAGGVTAPGGAIVMAEREGGGASVEFTLPVLAAAPAELGARAGAP